MTDAEWELVTNRFLNEANDMYDASHYAMQDAFESVMGDLS